MKSFKEFLTEAKENSKYKKGEFGYWWTVIEGKEDIEGKAGRDSILLRALDLPSDSRSASLVACNADNPSASGLALYGWQYSSHQSS